MGQNRSAHSSKSEKIHQIDHIPDHKKQRRSPVSKRRRSDFSFFSASSEYCRDGFSQVTTTGSDGNKGDASEFPEVLALRCHSSAEERLRPLSEFYGVPVGGVESFGQNAINHSESQQESEVAISEFENCFEERSCNSTEDFQHALKQALKRNEDIGSPEKSQQSPDGSIHSDKCASSISSMTEGDFPKPRRGTRQRRPNIRFNEVTFPENPARNVRRFRIMRNLGLIAPVGSPF